MDQQQQQLIDRIKQAQNVLVTVSANPSVDQLSAAIGLTLALNKIGKHGTAVFSGQVPSTLEFLKPEETLEPNTDSLRDFIIALDKSKADKLRYKVEDDVVRIFITPYKTSISDKDLQFSQGDFNVDVVVCLGVTEQQDLDTAITAHGRILHDATVACVSTQGQGSLGSINWVDPNASSLSEMMVSLSDGLDKSAMDNQIATALLTGIVASTERFRNDKTTPKTMSASAELMAAGANQSLIATQLETPEPQGEPAPKEEPKNEDRPQEDSTENEHKPDPGTLEINHQADEEADEELHDDAPKPGPQIAVDENGQLTTLGAASDSDVPAADSSTSGDDNIPSRSSRRRKQRRERLSQPPRLDGPELTANSEPEDIDAPTEELNLPTLGAAPLLTHDETRLNPVPAAPVNLPAENSASTTQPEPPLQPAPTGWQPPVTPEETLTEIEESVNSPHLQAVQQPAPVAPPQASPLADPSQLSAPEPVAVQDEFPASAAPAADSSVDDARSAVEAALRGADSSNNDPLQPIAALNAQPLGPELQGPAPSEQPVQATPPPPFVPPALPSVNPNAPVVPNTGFSEPTPGNSPADETLDMPLPPIGFGGQPAAPMQSPFAPPAVAPPVNPGVFPGAPVQSGSQNDGQTPPPPVPPPMLPPLQ